MDASLACFYGQMQRGKRRQGEALVLDTIGAFVSDSASILPDRNLSELPSWPFSVHLLSCCKQPKTGERILLKVRPPLGCFISKTWLKKQARAIPLLSSLHTPACSPKQKLCSLLHQLNGQTEKKCACMKLTF